MFKNNFFIGGKNNVGFNACNEFNFNNSNNSSRKRNTRA